MNVAMLLGSYYPEPTANGICARAILNTIEDCSLDVICEVNSEVDDQACRALHGNVIPVLKKPDRAMTDPGIGNKIRYLLHSAWKLFFGRSYSEDTSKKYVAAVEQIMAQKKIDVVVAVLSPVEAVEAAYRIKEKHPELKLIIYDLDTASNRGLSFLERRFKKFFLHKTYQWEKKVFRKADLIVHLAQHRKHFSDEKYAQFWEKFLFQEVPLLNCETIQEKREENPRKMFLYTGSFYRTLRAPELITGLMDHIREQFPCEIRYYVNDAYRDLLSKKYAGVDNVQVSGYVPEQEVKKLMQKADFLLSLGNKDSEMFPSKVVQYVAAGKPIIHVYQSEKDPVVSFLEDYPDKLILNSNDDFQENCLRLREFVHQPRPQIDPAHIRNTYRQYSPRYNGEQILNFFGISDR